MATPPDEWPSWGRWWTVAARRGKDTEQKLMKANFKAKTSEIPWPSLLFKYACVGLCMCNNVDTMRTEKVIVAVGWFTCRGSKEPNERNDLWELGGCLGSQHHSIVFPTRRKCIPTIITTLIINHLSTPTSTSPSSSPSIIRVSKRRLTGWPNICESNL